LQFDCQPNAAGRHYNGQKRYACDTAERTDPAEGLRGGGAVIFVTISFLNTCTGAAILKAAPVVLLNSQYPLQIEPGNSAIPFLSWCSNPLPISILGKSEKEFQESLSFGLPMSFVPGYFVFLMLSCWLP
jgi:hypothetical protein